ncbi:hypothetical protein K493DRAFT_311429 [Basidiobolus meristosporus CBS 931.73]|uniref:Ras-GAP domain-containing protein n=1 Tax=Basidiobolus meristosporus CBS 931.73 TaxID=1314790 RepID=A0A1Y1Z1N6_9FUNG|nr:hypothetical protein K493DRAFT_311429 [Basidiobolus meristosporus CBS 931.73]|eukprot:ORY04201.1 hypothetical protein K493DRAFT_311429 [Basidiobolus meristosporus CBS 931.73]
MLMSEDPPPVELLQSQLFVLRVLGACMGHHWKCYRDQNSTSKESEQSSQEDSSRPKCDSPETFTRRTSNNPYDSTSDLTSFSRHTSSIGSFETNLPTFLSTESLEDPPPLEEPLAKYILSIVFRFLQQSYFVDSGDIYGQSNKPTFSNFSMGSMAATTPSPSSALHSSISRVYTELMKGIHHAAGHILFYISASNWPIVYQRIKSRMAILTSTSDENADTSELKLLEWCNLNSRRLSTILQELCVVFLQFKRPAQMEMAIILRKAIWSFIEVYPMDFIALCQSEKRLEGGPEILFDVCNSLADSNKRKMILWPLQVMLLTLCPDILMVVALSDEGANKKAQFYDNLRKSLRSSRLAEVAAFSFVDLCKASTYVSKVENAALKLLVPEIESELREKLFDPQKPFLNYDDIIDQKLMTDCLTALFRLNPEHALKSLIPICLQANAPIAFRLVLVKTCYTIASESHLPWNPSISTMYSTIASPLRQLFQENIARDKPDIKKSLDRKSRRSQLEEANDRFEIVLNLLKLYRTDPMLAIVNENTSTRCEENRLLLIGITNFLQETNVSIRTTAAEALLELHQCTYIEQWCPSSMMKSFWIISSQVMLTIAKQMLDYKERDEGIRFTLELIHQLLIRRNEFLRQHQDLATEGADTMDRVNASIWLEVALLISLCSPETEICSLALKCLGHLCVEADITEENEDPQHSLLTIVENHEVYRELSSEGTFVTGRVAQQKRIRRMLRQIVNRTDGNLAACEEAYRRWRMLMQNIARPPDDAQPEQPDTRRRVAGVFYEKLTNATKSIVSVPQTEPVEDRGEWQNYTGFLCALGGVCLRSSAAKRNEHDASVFPSPHTLHRSSSENRRILETSKMINRFIQEMVEWLVCDNVIVREGIKEILGAELSPALHAILFKQLESIVVVFFDAEGEAICKDTYTLFVEQAISVVRLILDRLQEPSEQFYSIDIGNLILSFARYLNRLGFGHVALRIKIKMCQMCEILMSKKDYISLRQEIKFRNRMLETVVEWTSDYSMKSSDNQMTLEEQIIFHKNEKLHRDLDQACMKTIVVLLFQLPLQPSEPLQHDADLRQSKSRLFYKYFSFFIKLLNRCRILEVIPEKAIDNGRAKNNPDLQSLLSKSKEYCKDLGPLKDYTILALSNLLSANIDSGLKYSLSMGYHDDPKTRTAFMQVLTNILNQGTEFEGLAESSMTDRYDKLVELITDDDLVIALSLCEVCPVPDIDELASVLLAIFDTRGNTMKLMKAVIERELMKTESSSELFRRNCMATRLLAAFAKMYGSEYLRSTLQPILREMVSNNHLAYELDPTKMSMNSDAAKNLANLKQMSQAFLDVIVASAPKVPRAFREICHFLSTIVGERFPEAKSAAVGGFIFLRFFCPAIVAPETHNLVASFDNKEIRRGLLLITKVIQNLANNVLFGTKESFMITLNDFLTSNIHKVSNFLLDISVAPSDSDTESIITTNSRLEDTDLSRLHRHVFDNLERIGRDLSTRKQSKPFLIAPNTGLVANGSVNSDLEKPQSTSKKAHEKLSTVLAQLGPPPDVPRVERSSFDSKIGASNEMFREFMQRNGYRNTEPIKSKRLFYEGGLSKERRPVLYLILRRVIADAIDMELLILHILQTMESVMGKPYELLVDITQFGHANEIQNQWINQFLQILPSDAVQNLAALYMYNVNSAFKKFSKKLGRPLTTKIGKKTIFPSNLNDLYDYIPLQELRLPKGTIALETDPGLIFSPVTKIPHFRQPMPTIIKITNETVQVTSLRKQDIFGLNSYFNDVYHVSDIDDVALVTTRNDENNLVIKYDRGNSSMTFASPKVDLIFKAIRNSKARFQLSKPVNVSERIIRPNDVPGTLLNMALLNSGSEDPNLRSAAYNLLYALSLTFNFNVGNQLLSAQGLCIPSNNSSFIVSISEMLAASEPHLTLEFLSECFVGFNKSTPSLKHLCLEYMAPWLSNLAEFSRNDGDNQHNLAKTKEIIKVFIDMTVKEVEITPAIQAKIWRTIGKVDEIITPVLDAFVQYAVEHGIGSPQAELMAETAVTLSSVNVRGKLISRLRKVISSTSNKPMRTLTDHSSWVEIAVLIRFNLMLSFNNRLHVQHYLPELFHIVSMLVSIGPPIIRSSIHGLVVNIVQSLCTSLPLEEANLKKLNHLLGEFSEPKFRLLFGLNRMIGNAFARLPDAVPDMPESVPLTSLETIVHSLLEVIELGAVSTDVANIWRARWMSLVTSTAFNFNPAVQPRAFIVLGCLAKDEVDDDLLYQILVALRGSLALFDESDCNLIVSIVTCLTNIVENLPHNSRYLQQMFWLGAALVQIGHLPLFHSALNLMEVVVRSLDTNGFFADETPDSFLMKAREPLEDIAIELDKATGIQFRTNFSFALAATLLKGLKQPSTKTATSNVLKSFLEIFNKGNADKQRVNPNLLGYIAPLLPTAAKNGELRELLWTVGIYDLEIDNTVLSHTYFKLLDRFVIPDDTTAILLVSLMVTMLNNAEYEAEFLFLYSFLAEAAVALPDVFSLVYDNLQTKMNQILNSSQNVPIIEAVHSILYTMVSRPRDTTKRRNQNAILSELGFSGLVDCGSFQALSVGQMIRNAELASSMVEKIVG